MRFYHALAAFGLWFPLSYASTNVATSGNLTVAMIRAAPPNWPLPLLNKDWTGITLNISETVDVGVHLMHQAAANGADIVSFPELWFPGYPKGHDVKNWTVTTLPMYINNSLVIGSADWNRLIEGTKSAGVYAALAFSELSGDHLYMAQALISPIGDALIQRRKLRPSGSERWFFSDGTIDGFKVVTTSKGRIGMLECFEHYYQSMVFAMQAQKENIHIAHFPYLSDIGDAEGLWWEGALASSAAVRLYAINSGAYSFMHAIGYAEAFDPYGYTVAQINASVDMTETPILYATIDTSSFNTSKTYDVDGQESWAVAQQIVEAYPEYIPKVEGGLVPFSEHSVAWMLDGGLTTEVGEAMVY